MCDIVDLEEALQKQGSDLFKELYRIYPVAEPEDYIKNGQWRNDLMKQDLVLMESHRREAGAPDPPEIEDIKFPQLPNAMSSAVAAVTLGAKLGMGTTATAAQGGAGAAAAAGGAAVEVRLMALFVAKWKLDPVSAKTALSKLASTRRRYVIQHFKATTGGVEGTKELETYIEECEKEGAWDTATPGTTPAATVPAGLVSTTGGITPAATVRPTITAVVRPAAATPRPAASPAALVAVKRPVGAVAGGPPAWAANKRPMLTPTAGNAAKAAGPTVVSPKPAAKAGGPALVRPPVRPAGGNKGGLVAGLLSGF